MEKKKKIGVVTFWTAKGNYGQLLQAYALQRVLREAGHDAFLVRYDARTSRRIVNRKRWRWLKILNPFAVARHIGRKMRRLRAVPEPSRGFDLFLREHIVSTDVYSDERLNAAPPLADVYVCGSDQIWNKMFDGIDENYYLKFAPDGSRKIAYAPSFGGSRFSKKENGRLAGLLRDFDLVSVREKAGVEICRRAGRPDAVCVPDPTMLLSKSAYRELSVAPAPGRNYLLLYLIGWETALNVEAVYAFAREKDLDVIQVSGRDFGNVHPREYPTIPEWLGLVDGAEYVVTNSFHGSIFSILFNKRFSVALLSGRTIVRAMNERIDTLLRLTGLEGRVLGDDIHAIEALIDYAPVNAVIDREREAAKALLLRSVDPNDRSGQRLEKA